VTTWTQECPPPREELLKAVVGKDAIFCNLVDEIDKTLLDAAGKLRNIPVNPLSYVLFIYLELPKDQT